MGVQNKICETSWEYIILYNIYKQSYRRISKDLPPEDTSFTPAAVPDGEMNVRAVYGTFYNLRDPMEELMLPSIGRYDTEALVLQARRLQGKLRERV